MRAQKLYCITFAYEWQIRNEGEPNVFRFVTSFQSSRIASSAAAASAPRSPDGSGFHLHLHYIHANTTHSTHTHAYTALTIVYVSVRISDCAKPDPICIRLCCRFNYTPIPTKSGSGIQLRPLLCVRVYVRVCMCVPEHSPVLASPKTQWQTK